MPSKKPKTDGLGPAEIALIRSAVRQVWQRSSLARKIVAKRCLDEDGYGICEKCSKRCPKVLIDHIVKVGDVDDGFIKRLFCPSTGLQGLCKKCHDLKTKEERKK